MARHPLRRPASARAGKPDGPIAGEAGEHALVGNSKEEHGGNSLDCQSFECVGGTGEVVSVIGKQRRLCGERLHQAARNLVSAARSSGWNRAYSVNATPDTAASQACRRLRTPATIPSGCAMIPPPHAKIRSVDPSAR